MSEPPDAGHPGPDTRNDEYTRRLESLEGVWWKQLLDVQRPYRWNLHRLDLGRTLDIGCGIGRNLAALAPGSIGIDHNPTSVTVARSRGLRAMTPDEFGASESFRPATFDSLLLSHVIEHMDEPAGRQLVETYLPCLRPRGSVVFICPQERSYASDPTHVRFVTFEGLARLAQTLGLQVSRQYSFPFPRFAGRVFPHNEFVVRATKPS